jgi:hypothetical protein
MLVYWPSGLVQEFDDVPADAFYRVVEGDDKLAPRVVPAGTAPQPAKPVLSSGSTDG